MDENPAIRELDLAALIVRLTWIGAGLYAAAFIANDIYNFNTERTGTPSSYQLMMREFVGFPRYTGWYLAACIATTLFWASTAIIASYGVRTLIWIAVRHGAVPGQIMPESEES